MAISPCLWSNHACREMATYYTGLFPNSRIVNTVLSASDNPSVAKGEALYMEIELDGLRLTILNGGAQFPFTEAISLQFPCATQEAADFYYQSLIADGGEAGACGWLKDKFGVSWQVYPEELNSYVNGPDPAGAERAMLAMLEMGRIDLAPIKAAYSAGG